MWRERQPPKTTHRNPDIVLSQWENLGIPEQNLVFRVLWAQIANGEKIIREASDFSENPRFDTDAAQFVSRRLRERRDSYHLTQSGVPVRILHGENETMAVHSLVTDNRFALPQGYQFRPFKQAESAFKMRQSPYLGPKSRAHRKPIAPKPLAPTIDALLLKGGLTMRGLVREVKRRASSACRGKDVRANIRARMYWLKKRGSLPCFPSAG